MPVSPPVMGILLLLIGAIAFALVWGLLRLIPKLRGEAKPLQPGTPQAAADKVENAILLVEAGGRLSTISESARQMFTLRPGENASLEMLASRIRPAEEFLNLCARQGRGRFSLNGRPLECASYQVPGLAGTMMVTLNRPIIAGGMQVSESGSLEALRILTEFIQGISLDPSLEATVRAVLSHVERLIPAESLLVRLWNADREVYTQYQFGAEEGGERPLVQASLETEEGFLKVLREGRQALFLPDARQAGNPTTLDPTALGGIRSFIGFPLVVEQEFIGTLEASLTGAEAYSQEDFEVIQLVAPPTAVVLRNAMLLQKEERRAVELGGLAELARVLGSARDSGDLYANLVQSLTPLFDVKTLGFLIYNENRRALEAQVPFTGMPPQVVDLYHVPMPAGSPVEEVFLKQEVLLTRNAAEDEKWSGLGFQDYARAASWRDTALVPLVSSGRSLGYLQISNHNKPENAFSPEEMRLLTIVANETAPIIENVSLVMQARQRAQRSETLRRIISMVSSSATTDQALEFTNKEIAHLLRADMAAIFLLDETRGVLVLHEESLIGLVGEEIEHLRKMFVNEAQTHFSVTRTQHPYLTGQLAEEQRLMTVYHPLVGQLQMESAILVPLVVRGRSMGELIVASRQAEHFSSMDLQMITTAAGQVAAAIEGLTLSGQTDETLRRRVDQLMTITRLNREINTTTEEEYLLQVVFDEAMRLTRADCGSIMLFDQEQAADKTDPRVILRLGDQGGSQRLPFERQALQTGKALVVRDFTPEEEPPAHEGIQSALVVPIAYEGQAMGLINLHAFKADLFDPLAVDVIQTLAVQTAIALGNARRYQEQKRRTELLNQRTETISKLLETSHKLNIDEPLEQSLERLAHGIREATPFQVVLMSIIDPGTMMQERVAGVGIPPETLMMLKGHRQPWTAVQHLLRPEFKIGGAYFIPYEKRPLVPDEVQLVKIIQEEASDQPEAWHPEDALFFPLSDEAGNPVGLISVDAPRDNRRPERTVVETIEIFAAQAALVIQSSRRLANYKKQVDMLSTSLERQQQLSTISQSHLPTLLHKDLEQMIAISGLERRARRIRAGLEITETVNRQMDGPSALVALGREMLTRLDMSVSLIAENTSEGPRLTNVLGSVPRGTSPEALFGQRNPLRTCLQAGEPLLVMNVDQDDSWRDAPLLTSLRAKSFICLPIVNETRPVAGVLAISQEPLSSLSEEDRQVYYQISRQVSIILQNISLLTETRRRLREVNLLLDFSRQLSGLDAQAILKALLESALRVVTLAHAGVVLLHDPKSGLLIPQVAQGYADPDSLMLVSYRPGESLPGQVFAGRLPRRVDEVNFARDYVLPAEYLLHYREATGGRLPVSSLLLPIQTSTQQLGVMVLDNFNTPAAFTQEDETLLLSLIQQVALSLENVRLMQASQERTGQLQALTDVSATMTSSLKSDELVAGLLDSLHAVLPYDTAILWLRQAGHMTVAAARGFQDNEQRVGLTVAIEDSRLLAEMSRTTQGIVVSDVREDPRFPSLALVERLSWMGVPLVSQGEVVGVIALEKTEPGYFTVDMRGLVTTFASQAAVALENARLYEESLRRASELDERSKRLALLNRLSAELSGSLSEAEVLRLTATELHRALSVQRVSMVAFTPAGKAVLRLIVPGGEDFEPRDLPETDLFLRLRESLGVFSTDDVRQEAELIPLLDYLPEANSLLVLPLAAGQALRALAFLHMAEGYRSTPVEIELARTICNQAAIALESARLYQATVSRADQLATINRSSYEIGLSLDPEEIYTAIHRAAGELMPVESFVISLLDEEHDEIEGVYLMDPSGRAPTQRLPRDQGISGKVISTGSALLIRDAEKEDSGGMTYGQGRPRSILAVPVAIAGRVIGMLSAQSYQPNVYSEDDKQILSTLANQAAVALQNGRLFAETRRLAEELEQRVVERTAELTREQRNTETLLRIITEASSTLDLDRALNRTLALLNDAIGAEQASILMVDEKDDTIHYRAGYGYMTPTMTEGSRPTKLHSGEGLAGWVIKQRQSVCIADVRKDERWQKLPTSTAKHRSVVAAPLMLGEDSIGAIMAFHRQAGYFTPEQMGLVQAIGSQVSVAINNAKLYELIRDQAERLGSMYRNEQVEASRQQAILEAVADGVLVTDAENHITFFNPSAERILMLKSRAVLGHALDKFVGLFGDAAQTWIQTIRSWSENPASHEVGETYAEQLELENGRVVLVHLAPVIWREEFLGTVSIFRDITHEVEVDRLKSEFVATVSHELRTPMTSIKGYVDLLLMGAAGALNENQIHFLDIVHKNTDRLSVLVNDLLDISRIEAGRVSLSLEPIDLHEVVQDVCADIQRRSQEENKPMTLSVKAEPKLPHIMGDMERIRQIVANVVDNAYNYTPAEGKIEVHLHQVNGMVQVDVQDNGIGINPADAERVFDRFYRGEDPLVLATPGTGLGLAIVKQLVLMHKGEIWLESNGMPGEGSRFSFTLPVHQEKE